MPSRERWEALKPEYRARLERHGYTLEDYLANRPRQAGRGHGKTPEHPERALRNPTRYPEYVAKRKTPSVSWKQRALANARDVFSKGIAAGSIDKFDMATVEWHVSVSPVAIQRQMARMTLDEWRERGSRPAESFDVWVRDHFVNPFWYH